MFGHHVGITNKKNGFNELQEVKISIWTNHMCKYEFAFLFIVAAVVAVYQIFAKNNNEEPRIY